MMKLDKFINFIQKKQYLIYSVIFIFFLFIFFILRFPGDFIIDSTIQKFNNKSNIKITYSKVNFSLLSGITFKNLEISLPQSTIKIQKAQLKPSYLSLLRGQLNTFLKLKDPEGNLHGTIIATGKNTKIDITVNKLNLQAINFITNRIHAKLKGSIRGEIKLSFPGRWEKTNGLIALEGENLLLSDSPYLVMLGKKEFSLGSLSAMGRITNGKLHIETFKIGERDYYAKVGGEITLRTPLTNSMLNIQLKLKLNQNLQKKIGALLPATGFVRTPGGIYTKKIYGRIAFLF